MNFKDFLPISMRPPPTQERTPGARPVTRLWTQKARTSSRVLRLATRLGEMSCRDLVRVVKATRPEKASPAMFLSVVFLREVSLTNENGPVPGRNIDHVVREDQRARVEEAVRHGDQEAEQSSPEDEDGGGDVLALGHEDVHHTPGQAGDDGQHHSYREPLIRLYWVELE